jgi:hypothetical protein
MWLKARMVGLAILLVEETTIGTSHSYIFAFLAYIFPQTHGDEFIRGWAGDFSINR